ncbi:MAG: hypothetical protein NTY77_12245 [Elusimicrobia bacterium]|nr:hypothetical protein [Elusimicrobiota bacterium]
MADEVAQERVIVFEATNDTLREYYVCVSTLPLTADEIADHHKEKPPAAIVHWRKDHKIWYRCLEAGLTAADSHAFVLTYVEKLAQPGWKVLVD